MIAERDSFMRHAQCPERVEEPLRMPDPRQGRNGTIEPERRLLDRIALAAGQVTPCRRHERHRKARDAFAVGVGKRCRTAIADQRVDVCQALQRFPQGASWQTVAIAEPSHAIDDDQLQRSPQGVMLQTIVSDQNVATGMFNEPACRPRPIGIDSHRRAGLLRQHQRLVTALRHGRLARHRQRVR